MAYTPELDQIHAGILRRLAWALKKPMTRTLTEIVEFVSRQMDKNEICLHCRDDTFCKSCIFK